MFIVELDVVGPKKNTDVFTGINADEITPDTRKSLKNHKKYF